jgi:predicted RNA polymerase sigma factor
VHDEVPSNICSDWHIGDKAIVDGVFAGAHKVVRLDLVERLMREPSFENYHLLPSVHGDLLAKLDRLDEARLEFERAAALTRNARERDLLLKRAAACAPAGI